MKLAIFSDTHGNYPLVLRALDETGPVDGIIHLGDEIEDAGMIEDIVDCPVVKVAGNCDHGTRAPRELKCTFAGVSFFITHGDAYNVKAGLGKLREKAHASKFGVVLYGHTHIAAIEQVGETTFVNPGCLHKASSTKSFATITIDAGTVHVDIIPLLEVLP
ncbi:MAG TPA: YfcE family phosphodiesterase [Geobacteraceae bacterium]